MSEIGKHIHGSFDKELDALKEDVLLMATLTERSLSKAMNGLFSRDDDLCAAVIADDQEIDQLEVQVDRDGINIMLRFQPVASDLRQVVSAMKVSGNLERVADQAVNISRRSRKLNHAPALDQLALLQPMFWEAVNIFNDSVKAYSEGDVELALSLKGRDKKIDEFDLKVSQEVTDHMARNPQKIKPYLNLIFIARHLERVGDHAKAIGEDTIYATAAEDIRHQPRFVTPGPPAELG